MRTVLQTRYPATLLWGPDFRLLYNDAYIDLIGDKHPLALGAPAAAAFDEAWSQIGPLMNDTYAGRGASWFEDTLVPLNRRGYLEECYFTFSYSPIANESGEVEGVLDIATETTAQVLSQRRLELLSRLSDVLANVETKTDLRRLSLYLLREQTRDLPMVDIHLPGAGEDEPSIAFADTTTDTACPALPAGPGIDIGDLTFYVEQTDVGQVVWQHLDPAHRVGTPSPLLATLTSRRLPFDHDYRYFLRLIAASLNQALVRIDLLEAERRIASSQREIAIALQQALLTAPMQPDHLQIAVRYVPAADVAQIGGDWHDAFMQPDGALVLAIGDIAGHDLAAAAAMAQVRNLTRGIATVTDRSPARILEALDQAIDTLHVGTVATAIVARVEQASEQAATGWRTLRWSRAGHCPPVLLRYDGTAELLEEGGDVLLGVRPDTGRTDTTIDLEPGATVVLYTDGLVERRGVPLDVSFEQLRSAIAGQQHLDPEQLADHLLDHHPGTSSDQDDIALMILRAHPETTIPARTEVTA